MPYVLRSCSPIECEMNDDLLRIIYYDDYLFVSFCMIISILQL